MGPHQVPGQPEKLDPVGGVGGRALIILADVFSHGTVDVFFRGRQHQATRRQLLQDPNHPDVSVRVPVPHGDPRLLGRPDPLSLVGSRVGFSRPHVSPHRLQNVDNLGDLLLYVAEAGDSDAFGDTVGYPENEL